MKEEDTGVWITTQLGPGKGSGGGIPSVGRIGAANENLQSVEKSNWLLIWKRMET